MKKPDPYMIDEDCPELTEEFWKNARPAREVFPEIVAWSEARKLERREAQIKPKKALNGTRAKKLA
jgi:hypothetical protein